MPRAPVLQDQLRDDLRACGLRVTPARLAVLELVRAGESPMSHGDVADRLASKTWVGWAGKKTWDRATIYRNLIDLSEVGLLRRTDVGDHVWRFEAVGEDHAAHPHFVCTECGSVECLPDLEITTRRRSPRALRQRQIEVHVRGLCDACS